MIQIFSNRIFDKNKGTMVNTMTAVDFATGIFYNIGEDLSDYTIEERIELEQKVDRPSCPAPRG